MGTITDESQIQTKGKILVIDDERLLLQSIQKILEKAGFYVETASDFSSAKKRVKGLTFDLLLTDIVLPKMNGLKLIEKLQQDCDFEAAIIFITGEPNLETCEQAIKLGAADYLEKPVDRVHLLEAVKNALLHKKHTLLIYEGEKPITITLSSDFLNVRGTGINTEQKKVLNTNLQKIHDALSTLKKRFGEEFTEDQRELLNIIAQNSLQLKKILKKSVLKP